MPSDVRTETGITRPVHEVAAFAADPAHATSWYRKPGSGGGTRMTLHNRGEPHGFSRLATPFMARAMRRANRQDLRRLSSCSRPERDPANDERNAP